MDRLSRYTTILVFCVGLVGLPRVAVAQAKVSTRTTPGSIAGRVTIGGKGVPGVVVGARNAEFAGMPEPSIKGTTDADGNYQITGLPPDTYQVSPFAPTHVWTDDRVPARLRAKTILLGEGEAVNGIDFSLTRGGVITGKVTDADGKPVIEENVQILFEDQSKHGQMIPSAGGYSFMTDDRGIYRIYGIPAGRYRVAVGQGNDLPFANPRSGRAVYKRTYYPDAAEMSAGEVVEVTEGGEASNIDITVGRTLPSFAVSGKVVEEETLKPVAGLTFGLRRQVQAGGGPINASSLSTSQGEFRVENVPPGKYWLIVLSRDNTEALIDPLPFDLVDHDVEGLVVKTKQGQTLSGSVVIENSNDRSVYAKLLQERLLVYVRMGPQSPGQGREGTLNSDGSFRVSGLQAGQVTFSLNEQDRRKMTLFRVQRVERDGVAEPRGLEIKTGENIAGVKLFVVYGSATVRGQVRFLNGELPGNVYPSVWLKKVGETGNAFRSSFLDARGRFVMENVPAGSYEVNVNLDLRGSRPPVPKQVITVSEGGVTEVDIPVDIKPISIPTPSTMQLPTPVPSPTPVPQ
ncbi:MAG TPA: hypothetical protein VLL54_19480 [Pyrinomonadaceae bacterium]|nr:hypothetical protein [Pyrinomonadaceae bacterium]